MAVTREEPPGSRTANGDAGEGHGQHDRKGGAQRRKEQKLESEKEGLETQEHRAGAEAGDEQRPDGSQSRILHRVRSRFRRRDRSPLEAEGQDACDHVEEHRDEASAVHAHRRQKD